MLVLRIVLSLLVAGIAISIGRVLYSATQVSNIEILLLTLIVSSRLYIVRSVPEAVLRSIGRYYLAASFALIDAVLFAVLLATLRNSALTLHQIVWIYTLCNLPGFVLIVGFVGVWVKKSNFRLSVQWRTVVEMIRGSVPLTLGSVFLMVHYESDKLLLDKLSNPFEVSAYGATIRLLTAASPLALVISAVTAPELTRLLFRGDLERARRLTHMSLRVLLVVAGCIALIVTAYSSQLIIVLYGQKYANEGSLFALSSWMLIPLFFAGYINEMSIAAGEFRSWTFYNLFIMLVLIAGDVLLIPSLGASGAMISRLASIVLGSALILYLKRGADYLDLRIARSTFLKLIACIAIAFAILKLMAYFESAMTLGIAAALVAYFLSVHLSRMLSYHDAMSVLRRVRLP